MGMNIDGKRFFQNIQRSGCIFGGLSRGCRASWREAATKHRADRCKGSAPHPTPAGQVGTAGAAAIHDVLSSTFWAAHCVSHDHSERFSNHATGHNEMSRPAAMAWARATVIPGHTPNICAVGEHAKL
jgi:hypothetical protein